jgi:hypothetical protein
MSRIPLKYHTNVLFYTKYTHPTLICRGTDVQTDRRTDAGMDARMDARTDRQTENIYSIFRDKLLLLGEHVQDMYPFPDNVDEVPNFTACTNDNKHAAAKILHTILLKTRNDLVNMNATLINTFLSLIPMAFKLLYEQESMMNPNAVFQNFFDRIVIKYQCTLAEDCETDWMAIAADWHPSMGLEVLTSCLFCGVTFASLSGHPITDKNTLTSAYSSPKLEILQAID